MLSQDDAAQIMRATLVHPQWGWTGPIVEVMMARAHLKLHETANCSWDYRIDLMRYYCDHDSSIRAIELHTNAGSCRN